MRKDYAKRSVRSKRSLEQGWLRRFLFVIFILFLLGMVSYRYYFYKMQAISQPFHEWVTTAKSFFHQTKPLSMPTNNLINNELKPAEADPEIHFDFYTELSAMPVMTPAKMKNVNVNHSTNINNINNINKSQLAVISVQQKSTVNGYIVQLGLFKNASEVNKLRLSILLEGVESQIIKTNKGFYRLQQGPFSTLAYAEEAQNKLKNKGIISLIHHADLSSSILPTIPRMTGEL